MKGGREEKSNMERRRRKKRKAAVTFFFSFLGRMMSAVPRPSIGPAEVETSQRNVHSEIQGDRKK